MQTVDLSGPRAGVFTSAAYWSHFMLRHLAGPEYGEFGPAWSERLLRRLERRIEIQSQPSGERRVEEVPQVAAADISAAEFQRLYLNSNTPVHIKGMALEWGSACWNPQYFADHYGDCLVPVRLRGGDLSDAALQIVDMSVAELVENIAAGGKYFGANMADIFNSNPELRRSLDLETLTKYMVSAKHSKIGSTQMFLSGPDTCSGFHCTGGINMFAMISGSKEWTFVPPQYSKWMYPVTRKDMFYSASKIDWRRPLDDIADDGHSLYRYIPKYRARLEAGDVLFSPQWWWHAVETTEPSIGVAIRAMNSFFLGNHVFAALWTSSREFRALLREVLRDGWGSDAKSGARLAFEQRFVDSTTA